jgi:hypothetical protein
MSNYFVHGHIPTKHEGGFPVKRTLLILAVTFCFIMFDASPTDAGTTPTVNIVAVDVRTDGTFLVDISQPTTGAPSCVTVTNRLSANSNTAGGKAILQLAISVYLSGRPVSFDGTGACSEFPNIESISRIYAH